MRGCRNVQEGLWGLGAGEGGSLLNGGAESLVACYPVCSRYICERIGLVCLLYMSSEVGLVQRLHLNLIEREIWVEL